jgi:TerC family integral membrane protein
VHVSIAVWVLTIAGLLVIAVVDLIVIARRRAPISPRTALTWIAVYVTLALVFAAFLFVRYGSSAGSSFLASYVTEYSLSADNLFVFMILIARFDLPAIAVDRVLYLGITTSLIMRAAFIVAGAAAIASFRWVFYLFGAFMLYTALRLVIGNEEEAAPTEDSWIARLLRRVLRTTTVYDGKNFTVTVDGQRLFTPVVLVVGAISIANVVFALDSIPAVFGITKEPFIVLTANAFALMGLRQLYFLIGDLLRRLVYLNIGLAVLLGFIGVKLILEALHESGVHSLGTLALPVVGSSESLLIVVGILAVTAAASLLRRRGSPGEPV